MANGVLLLGQIVSGKPGFQSLGMIACALSIVAVFGLDLFTPLGAGVSFLYTIVVWAGVWRATPNQAIALSTVSSVLIIFGFFLSPGTVVWNTITNRVISLVSLWFVLYFGMSYRKAVDTLSERERELTDFVENAPVGMHWVGRNGTLLWANQEALNMLGYSREEYLGHHIAEFYADRNVIEDVRDTLNANVTLKNHEARLRHKDGSLRHVLISSNAYFDDGRFVHTRCFTRDITDRVWAERATSESEALAALNAQLRAETIERRAAEEVLREREELLRVTFDSAPVGISIVDPDGRFIKTNVTYQRMVGYSEEELRDETNFSITHPDDCPHIRTLRQELIAGKRESFEIEKRNRTKNGELIWVRSKVSQIKDGVGKPRFTVAVVQDITERKRAEEELRRSEERFSKIFRSSPIAIAIGTMEEGRLIDANDRYLEFFGYQRDEMIGRTGLELGLWADPNERAKVSRQAKERGSVREFEGKFRRKSGEIAIALYSREYVQLHGETVKVTMRVDITERQRAEKELREREELLRATFDSAPIGISMADLEGRYVKVNSAYESMVGYTEDELRHKTVYSLTHHDDLPQNRALREELISGKRESFEIEKRDRTRNGELIWVHNKVSLIKDDLGKPRFTVAVCQDITGRKLAENALKESEERFALFMHHLPGVAFVKNAEGRHLYANPMAEGEFRKQPGGWQGKSNDELFPAAVAKRITACDHLVLRTGKAVQAMEVVKSNHEVRHWLVNKFPIPTRPGSPPLLGGIGIDITAIKRAEEAVRRSEQQLRDALEERENLFRDLHDNVVQAIYAIGMRLEACQRLINDHSKDVAAQLAHAIDGLNGVISDVRRYISGAQPQILSGPRLRAELAKLVQTVGATNTLRFRLNVDAPAIARLTPEQAEDVLYIAREALSNALRHSNGRRGVLSMHLADTGVRFEISDDGVGFDPRARNQKGGGLCNMEARAQHIGAKLEILSSLGEGARIILQIPNEKEIHDIA